MAKSKKNNIGKLTVAPGVKNGASKHDLFIIDHTTNNDKIYCPVINGEVKGHGLVKRDFATHPRNMFGDPPSDMPLRPRSDWDALIEERQRAKATLKHIRNRGDNAKQIRSLDQNGQGYCWFYSVTMAVILLRAAMGQPHVRLSAHAGACKIKNFRDEGGWCGLGAKFLREVGVPSVALWPEKSMSRSHDKPETWANAALHKVTEEWIDLGKAVYDQNLTVDQLASCLLSNIPCAVDYDEWGHSICAIDWVKIEAGSYGPEIINSWTDQWGNQGTGIIQRSWTVDGAVALRVTGASPD